AHSLLHSFPTRRSSDLPSVAEATKMLENIFRYVNIALVNELAVLHETLGVDFVEAINAAATKPFGFMPHYPGPGVGGHCIPKDRSEEHTSELQSRGHLV